MRSFALLLFSHLCAADQSGPRCAVVQLVEAIACLALRLEASTAEHMVSGTMACPAFPLVSSHLPAVACVAPDTHKGMHCHTFLQQNSRASAAPSPQLVEARA